MSNRGRHKNNKHPLVKLLGKRITDKMMFYQKEQGNIPNLDIFLKESSASRYYGGFSWDYTEEGFNYWSRISSQIANHIMNL